MSATDIVTIVVAMPVAYIVIVILWTTLPLFQGLVSRIGPFLMSPFAFVNNREDERARRQSINDEIDRELGRSDPWGRAARTDIIQATLDSQRIRILDKKFRAAVQTCLQSHWAIAAGLGATHMSEAARHPLAGQQRQRVIDLAEHLSDTIEVYPLVFDSPELVRLHVGLHRIAPTCLDCPYWTTSVAEAPRVCPPARALGCGPTARQSPAPNA